ncbi:MAG: efflux RND transporter periplasmic adaptor subunit [Bacillota bacterium]
MKKIIFLIFISLLVGCQNENLEQNLKKDIQNVEVIEVKEEKNPVVLNYLGNIEIVDSQNFSFNTGGEISNIFVNEGDFIKKGQKIIALDNTILKKDKEIIESNYKNALSSIEEAKNNYNFKLENFNKKEKLYNQGAISQIEYETLKLDLEKTKSQLEKTKENLKNIKKQKEKIIQKLHNLTLRSEISGIVTYIDISKGENVVPNKPLIKISNSKKEIKTGIIRQDLKHIKINDNVNIHYDEMILKGKVKHISKIMNRNTNRFPVKIEIIDNTKNLIDQSIVDLEFIIDYEKEIWLPIDTVIGELEDYVFIYKDGKVIKKKIEILETTGFKIKVKGIKPSTKVITKGKNYLNDGDLVKIKGSD